MTADPGGESSSELFRRLDHAARNARAGVAGGIRFQVIFFLVNDDRLANDRIRAAQAHLPFPIEVRLAGSIRFDIAEIARVTISRHRSAVMSMRRIKMGAG